MKLNLNNRSLPGKPGRLILPFVSDELKSLIKPIKCRALKWTAFLLILPILFFPIESEAQAQGKTYTVNSTGDEHDLDYVPSFGEIGGAEDGKCDVGGGKCTLRAAIENHRINAMNPAINDPNDPNFYFSNKIEFDIPLAAGQSVAKIMITSFLRPILGKLHIDGTTQPNYDPVGNKIIEIDGSHAGIGAFGFWLVGKGSVIEGLSIHSFDGRGILISATGGVTSNHIVQYCFIGVDATGKTDLGNNAGGIHILGSFSTNNNQVFSNLIAGNGGPGVEIDGGGSTSFTFANDNLVNGNSLGSLNILGGPIPNDGEGVLIHNGARNNKVQNNAIVANLKDGVRISGLNTDGNLVKENRIGIRGDAALPNQKNGVAITAGAKNNTIGVVFATGFGYSNTISGNIENGVLISGEGTDENIVQNNLIGTNGDGDAPRPNQKNGVLIQDKAKNNIIGEEFLGNLISGNIHNGVLISGAGTDKNIVGFNLIGTNTESLIPVGNQMNGVAIEDGAKENEIGAALTGRAFGNIISGNVLNGVLLTGSGTDNNEVGENHIGTNGTGTVAVPNGVNGVLIQDKAQRNKIGVGIQMTNNGNDISGNTSNGVLITGEGTDRNEVWYNFFGPPGNLNGILVQDKAKFSSLAANTIKQNRGTGIIITGEGTTNNLISGNKISNNQGIGIDLGNDGPTPNDPAEQLDGDSGPNELQNFPEIVYADSKGIIKGVLKSAPLRNYRIEIFSNGACDPSGFGEGEFYIGVQDVLTDDFGLAEFTIDIGDELGVGAIITATATDITESSAGRENNTSEFSPCHTVVAAPATGNADLKLIQAVDKTSLILGETITFSLTLSNDGPDAATNIIVRDLLPAAFTFNSASASVGTYDNITGNWSIGSLGRGAQATLTIIATAAQAGNLNNVAEIIASDQDDPDSDAGNNNPGEDDQSSVAIEIKTTVVSADLELSKTANKTSIKVGEAITFTITIINKGPDAATNIVITEMPPAGLAFTQATASTGSYNSTTHAWTISSLASGANATLTLEAVATKAGTLTNTAQVTASDQPDPDSSPNNGVASEDDQSSVTITITDVVQNPAQLISQLISKVNALVGSGQLSDKEAKKLNNHLENALKQVNKGNVQPAINQLENFIKEVDKLVSRKELSSAIGQELIAAAEQIIQLLNSKNNATNVGNAVKPKSQMKSAGGDGYKLYPAAPNPFNTSTRIVFALPQQNRVQIAIYDNEGRIVVSLIDKVMAAGVHTIEWRAGNLPKGVYVVRLKAGEFIQTQRMIYAK